MGGLLHLLPRLEEAAGLGSAVFPSLKSSLQLVGFWELIVHHPHKLAEIHQLQSVLWYSCPPETMPVAPLPAVPRTWTGTAEAGTEMVGGGRDLPDLVLMREDIWML